MCGVCVYVCVCTSTISCAPFSRDLLLQGADRKIEQKAIDAKALHNKAAAEHDYPSDVIGKTEVRAAGGAGQSRVSCGQGESDDGV